jgi:carbamoyltransferase
MQKMLFLGISDFQYNAGITVMKDGEVLFAINEERLTRRKGQGGFPYRSLEAAKATLGDGLLSQIEHVYVSSIMNPPIVARLFDFCRSMEDTVRVEGQGGLWRYLSDIVHYRTCLTTAAPDSMFGKITKPFLDHAIRKKLPPELNAVPITFVEHHSAHAACAYFTSGFENALCITADEMGDGLSLTVNHCHDKTIERTWTVHHSVSLGYFYLLMTEVLGFRPMRHEGKVTGLAAYGDHTRVSYAFPLQVTDEGELVYRGGFGFKEVKRLRKELLSQYSREDIAAWLQYHSEQCIVTIVQRWIQKTGLHTIVLAGGF